MARAQAEFAQIGLAGKGSSLIDLMVEKLTR